MIGKGTMGSGTRQACQEVGCVHLGKMGMMTGGAYAERVEKVLEGHWLDMGTSEALWILLVRELGPFVVDMDAEGNLMYDGIDKRILNEGVPRARRTLGIEGFRYALGEEG